METMENQEYSQLDLFNKTGNGESSAQRLSGTFLSYIRTYERLVLMLIGIVITGVVCYCVGVEKGKHIALSQTNLNLDIAAATQPARTAPQAMRQPAQAVPVRVNQPVTVTKAVPQAVPQAVSQAVPAAAGAFTIQVASYSGKATAQQEIADLKKQGMLPVLKASGKYTVLCVGSFPDQATAKSLLTQLKRKYRDCYIRRL